MFLKGEHDKISQLFVILTSYSFFGMRHTIFPLFFFVINIVICFVKELSDFVRQALRCNEAGVSFLVFWYNKNIRGE
jgi:hypothetical protein